MDLTELTHDVFVCLQEDRGLGCSNSGLVRRGGGLIVDTFWDLPHTREMIATYAPVMAKPVRRVVNTHHNGDHCWGNQLFRGAEIIGNFLFEICKSVPDWTPGSFVDREVAKIRELVGDKHVIRDWLRSPRGSPRGTSAASS